VGDFSSLMPKIFPMSSARNAVRVRVRVRVRVMVRLWFGLWFGVRVRKKANVFCPAVSALSSRLCLLGYVFSALSSRLCLLRSLSSWFYVLDMNKERTGKDDDDYNFENFPSLG
jgi:hypothetical protein